MKIISDVMMWSVLKYPTGKKDGNKLGKRKRNLRINTALLVNDELHVAPEDYARVNAAFEFGSKLPDISVRVLDVPPPKLLYAPPLVLQEEVNGGIDWVRQPTLQVLNPVGLCAVTIS
jgi:hypothetical protein